MQSHAQANLYSTLMLAHAERVVSFLSRQVRGDKDTRFKLSSSHLRLFESMRYSLLQDGGKRFRPVLSLLTSEALGADFERALPFAAAIECIHTYSLIHDDLPSMDNDDVRRGLPTNHKKFDEATAILAGDALLTEAFQIIADNYVDHPQVALLVATAARAAGARGMVGGQAIDMSSKKDAISLDELRIMHELKTGALISASAVGAAIACQASEKQKHEIGVFADNLGLAFQVADDLLDFDPDRPEPGSYPSLLGAEATRQFLFELTETCLSSLEAWSAAADPLREIARFNRDRQL